MKIEFKYEEIEKNFKVKIVVLLVYILTIIIDFLIDRNFIFFHLIALIFGIEAIIEQKNRLQIVRKEKERMMERAQKIRLEKIKRECPENIIDVQYVEID